MQPEPALYVPKKIIIFKKRIYKARRSTFGGAFYIHHHKGYTIRRYNTVIKKSQSLEHNTSYMRYIHFG